MGPVHRRLHRPLDHRIHLVNQCHDPLGLKFCQNQNTHHDQDTHGNHDRNGMYYRGRRSLWSGYTDDAAIVQTCCVMVRSARPMCGKCGHSRPSVFQCCRDFRTVLVVFQAFAVREAVIKDCSIRADQVMRLTLLPSPRLFKCARYSSPDTSIADSR